MRALTRTLVLLGLAAAPSPGLTAQWGVSAEIGVARFGGTARDTSGTTVGPYRPTTFACRIDRQFGAVRGGIALLYAHPGLADRLDDERRRAEHQLRAPRHAPLRRLARPAVPHVRLQTTSGPGRPGPR